MIGIFLLLLCRGVFATVVQPNEFKSNATLLRDQAVREDLQKETLQTRPDVFLPKPSLQSLETQGTHIRTGMCFPIDRIDLEDAPAAWLSWLNYPAPILLPRCMKENDIRLVMHILAKRLIEHGYITSHVDLPQQNLFTRTLKVKIIPGYLQGICTKEGATDLALHSAFAVKRGDILNIRDLEQGLEQLMRPMTQEAWLDIMPGDEIGTSDIVVRRDNQFPLTVGMSVDNFGRKAVGRWQLGGYIVWDRPLRLNDSLMVFYNQDSRRLQSPGSRGSSLIYTLPWGNWTWSAALSYFTSAQTLQIGEFFLDYGGRSHSWQVSGERLLFRDQTRKTNVNVQLSHKATRSFFSDFEIGVHRRRLSTLEIGINHRHYLGHLTIDAYLGMQRGINWFHAEEPLPGADSPSARQSVYVSKISAKLPFRFADKIWQWSSQLQGQYSKDGLFSLDQFSIGSHYSVRGFQTELTGSGGFYWRNDLTWYLLSSEHSKRYVAFYVGLDMGRVTQRPSYDLDTQRLIGWIVGMRSSLSKNIAAELSVEKPLYGPAQLAREPITYFKMTVSG